VPVTEHYFSTDPATADRPREISFDLGGRHYSLSASSGVFSAGRLDTGTAVLLRKAELPTAQTEGNLLDLGCGYGPIATVLATVAPKAVVWAVDVNARARDLTRLNTRHLNVNVAAPEEVPADVRFAQIWSNPPIRIGKAELHAMLLEWLPRLDDRGVEDGGVAWLVVGRHLGGDSLQKWLNEQGWVARRHASGSGFRVLKVSRT
jgi:16S rRNA (guanine1207-N2)-methyltransferase